jgi:DNA end-binding protein Ku
MFFADEVRNPREEIDNLPGKVKLSPQELRMAQQLIESMSGDWKPSEYRDTYTDRVNELIKAKSKNKEFEPAEEAPSATNVVNLMDALRASVDAAKAGRRPAKKTAAKKTTAKKTAAKKTAAKKTAGKKTAGKKTAGKKTAGKKTAGKKTAAKKTAAKKRSAKKTAA